MTCEALRMPVHRLTFTGHPLSLSRIWDQIREQHAAIIVEDSWSVAEVGEVLKFNTTDWRMIMNMPLVILTDLQADLVPVHDGADSTDTAPAPPAPLQIN